MGDIFHICRLRLAALTITVLLPLPANAVTPPRGVWFIGGTGSESSSAYMGGVWAVPGASLGHGLAVRGSLNAGYYKYDASGTKIAAKYTGIEAAIVYQRSGRWGWANFSAGPKFTRTDLSPGDLDSKIEGSRWSIAAQSDGSLGGHNRDIRWFGSYGIRDQDYHARLQFGAKLGPRISIGPELELQGDPSYRQRAIGAFIRGQVLGNVEISASGGVTKQRRRGLHPYVAFGLSRVF